MGEAKRRRQNLTLDGGPPSNDQIALNVELFLPFEALLDGNPNHLKAAIEWFKRAHQHPTPLCAACDYEFHIAETPALLFTTSPFIPKGENIGSVSGCICPQCARKSDTEIFEGIAKFWRRAANNPNLRVVQAGRA